MLQWPPPTTPKQLRGFLGLTGFYRRFFHRYAQIAEPLTQLLRKDGFKWTPEAQTAFAKLKEAMTATPVLALPDFTIPFVLETDASGSGMGDVLMQRGHPIAYFSKQFCPKLLRSFTYIRELHTITTAVKRWRQYLLGHTFVILTDHKSLRELMTQPVQTPEQHVYLAKLLGYNYSIQYKAGRNNVVADALSRLHEPDSVAACFQIISMPHPQFLDELKRELSGSDEFKTLMLQVRNHPSDYPGFKIRDNLLLFQGSIWLNQGNPFIPLLLEEYHKSPLGGHMGLAKTLGRLQQSFFWEHMRRDTQNFIKQCSNWLQTKYTPKKPAGHFQPIPPPSRPWEDLALDFITGLPISNGATVIMTVVDRFSKGGHFGTLPTHFTAHMAAHLFIDLICKLHSFPRSLISDRDPLFLSKFWRELSKLSGTKLRMSMAYHPQSDGQSEVLNRVVEQYLRSFVHAKPANWHKFLSLAEWCYSTSRHSATGLTPYEVTYGKPPPAIPDYLPGTSDVEAVDFLLTSRQDMFTTL